MKKFSNIEDLTITNKIKFDDLFRLYIETVGINNVDKNTEYTLKNFDDLIKQNNGSYIVIKKKHTIISVAMLINDEKNSNLILNLNDKKFRRKGSNSFLVKEILDYCVKKKIDILDFNGANSPNRADDKHSYGASSKVFFEILLEN